MRRACPQATASRHPAILRMSRAGKPGTYHLDLVANNTPSADELDEHPLRRTSERLQAWKGLILVRLILLSFSLEAQNHSTGATKSVRFFSPDEKKSGQGLDSGEAL